MDPLLSQYAGDSSAESKLNLAKAYAKQ